MNTAFQAGHVQPEVVVDTNVRRDIPKAAGEQFHVDRHQTLVKVAIVAALCGSCPPALAALAEEPLPFNIPSGPLSDTLIEIGKRSGTLVSFSPRLVEGEAAVPVQGHFTPMQAFMRALSASGLSINVTPNGTVTVYPSLAETTGTRTTTERPGPAEYETPRSTEDSPQALPATHWTRCSFSHLPRHLKPKA